MIGYGSENICLIRSLDFANLKKPARGTVLIDEHGIRP